MRNCTARIIQCFFGFLLVLGLAACNDASMRIMETPFFVHEPNRAVPGPRNNTYPVSFRANMQDIENRCQAATASLRVTRTCYPHRVTGLPCALLS